MGWDGMGRGKSAGGRRAQRIGGIGARSALDQQRIISGYFLRQGVGVYLRGERGTEGRHCTFFILSVYLVLPIPVS